MNKQAEMASLYGSLVLFVFVGGAIGSTRIDCIKKNGFVPAVWHRMGEILCAVTRA